MVPLYAVGEGKILKPCKSACKEKPPRLGLGGFKRRPIANGGMFPAGRHASKKTAGERRPVKTQAR